MKSSCIEHPTDEPLIIVRQWQIQACDGNKAAAALLSFFEYWHNIKIEMRKLNIRQNDIAQKHGDARTQDEGLWQFHTTADLEAGLLLFKKDAIAEGVKVLEQKGFIVTGKNPNPKYAFDRTRYFLFKADTVTNWLRFRYEENRISLAENRSRSAENLQQSPENRSRSAENLRAITETTYEITSETTYEEKKTEAMSDSDKPKSDRNRDDSLSDEEWLKQLQETECYKSLPIPMLFARMVEWCKVNKKQPTRRRFINWLNREDKPMVTPIPARMPAAKTSYELRREEEEKQAAERQVEKRKFLLQLLVNKGTERDLAEAARLAAEYQLPIPEKSKPKPIYKQGVLVNGSAIGNN